MARVTLKERVAALEAEIARLQAENVRLTATIEELGGDTRPWWEKIAGSFANDPAFEEAMRLGREWRESFRPKARKRKKRR
jgi:hypothetical protein